MRAFFDQLSKGVLQNACRQAAEVGREVEISGETQRVDVLVQPDPTREAERLALGLLGRMIERSCLLEAYHQSPGATEIRACMRKQLAFSQQQRREARSEKREMPPFPRLWVLSAGKPRSLFAGYGLRRMVEWPNGFYEGSPLLEMGVVVIPELPETRETLLLRLLGAKEVFKKAVMELAELSPDSWEWNVASPVLRELQIELEDDTIDAEEEALMRKIRTFKTYTEMVAEGVEQGIEQGLRQAILAILQTRSLPVQPKELQQLEACRERTQLEQLLKRAVVIQSSSELFSQNA